MSQQSDLDIASDPALESDPPAPEPAAQSTPAESHHTAEAPTDGAAGPTAGAALRAAAHRDPEAQPAPPFTEPLGAKPPGGRRRRERPPLTGAVTIVRPPTPPVAAASPNEALRESESSTDQFPATISATPTPTVEPPDDVVPDDVVPDDVVPDDVVPDDVVPDVADHGVAASASDQVEGRSPSADLAPGTASNPAPDMPAASIEIAPSVLPLKLAAPAVVVAAPASVATELTPAAAIPVSQGPEPEPSAQHVAMAADLEDPSGHTSAAAAHNDDAHDEDAHRGRRRAASRHRNSRSVRLPTSLAFFLHYGLPIVMLVVLYIVTLIQFSYAPATTGPLPQPVVLVATLITIALTFVVSRRLGLSSLGAVVAAALVTIAPAAIDSDAAGVTEHLAIIGLLGSVAFIAARRQLIVALPAAALLAAAAAVLSPLTLVAAPFLAFHAAKGWRRRRGRRPVIAAAVVFVAALVIGTLIVGMVPL